MESQLRFMAALSRGMVSWAARPNTGMSNGAHWLSPADFATHGRE